MKNSHGYVSGGLPLNKVEDTVDRALAQVGLTKQKACIDLSDMENFGGGEFRLPFFTALHSNPYKIPFYASTLKASLQAASGSLRDLTAFGCARVGHPIRRGLVGDPLSEARKKIEEPNALVNSVIYCFRKRGVEEGFNIQELKGMEKDVPLEIAKQAALIIYVATDAAGWRDRAMAAPASKYGGDNLFSRLSSYTGWLKCDEVVLDVMHTIDFPSLLVGAQDLAIALDEAIASLAKVKHVGGFRFECETPLGWVVLSGDGDDFYRGDVPYLLIIDVEGDDVYHGGGATISYSNAVSILIDASGNDAYQCIEKSKPSFGAGLFGYGFLADLKGNDKYQGVNFSQGSGAFGVGALLDFEGDDRYSSYTTSQGSACFGLGILSDLKGNDVYDTFTQSQGFGFTKGFGVLIDVCGDDSYVADDSKIDFPSSQTHEHNLSLSQGAGFGRRADYSDGHSLAGGVGMLVDCEGNDNYSAGVFAQGAGYWYGVGILVDGAGDDAYTGVWYVQGSAAHFAVGILINQEGNDRYKASHHMAIGAGHDFSVGFLVDEAGNDSYEAPDLSLGAGNANGIGIFWDKAGDDVYIASGRTLGKATIGAPRSLREGMLCLGIFADGGGNDAYSLPFVGNNRGWIQRGALPTEIGVGLDEESCYAAQEEHRLSNKKLSVNYEMRRSKKDVNS